MKRRDFIKIVGGACAIPASSVAWSQGAGRTGRIGILAHDRILDDSQGGGPNWRAFFDELAAGGFIEGTNFRSIAVGSARRLWIQWLTSWCAHDPTWSSH